MTNTPNYWFDWRIRGIPSDIWVRFSDRIGQLITKEKLVAIDARQFVTPNQIAFALSGQMPPTVPAVAETAKAKANVLDIYDIRGGMKTPHVHFKGAIYALNDAQWKAFTAVVVADFKNKLESAGAVSFDQALDIAETAARLG